MRVADMEQWKTLEREAPCTMLRRKSAPVNCFVCARTQRWSIRSTRGACRLWTSSSIQPHEFRGLSYATNHNQIAHRCYWALAHQILKFYYRKREKERAYQWYHCLCFLYALMYSFSCLILAVPILTFLCLFSSTYK